MPEHNLVVTGFSRYDKAYLQCGKEGLPGCGFSMSLGWTPTVEHILFMKRVHDIHAESKESA